MKSFIRIVVVLLAATPALATAQRGMGGMGGGRGGRRNGGDQSARREEPVKFPSAGELQRYNPAGLLVDNKKRLSLSDSQVAGLTALRGRIYSRNADLLARYDSARNDYRPPNTRDRDTSAAQDSVRRAAMAGDRLLRSLLDSLRERRNTDVRETLDFVPDAKQHKPAVDLLNHQDADFLDQMPRPAGGFGARRGYGRPGRASAG